MGTKLQILSKTPHPTLLSQRPFDAPESVSRVVPGPLVLETVVVYRNISAQCIFNLGGAGIDYRLGDVVKAIEAGRTFARPLYRNSLEIGERGTSYSH